MKESTAVLIFIVFILASLGHFMYTANSSSILKHVIVANVDENNIASSYDYVKVYKYTYGFYDRLPLENPTKLFVRSGDKIKVEDQVFKITSDSIIKCIESKKCTLSKQEK